MGKRAQVTLFIIIGLLLIIAASIVIYLYSGQADDAILTELPGRVQYAGQ